MTIKETTFLKPRLHLEERTLHKLAILLNKLLMEVLELQVPELVVQEIAPVKSPSR